MSLLNRHRCTRIVHKALTEVRHLAESMEVDPALRACWDADRLDLWRVGIDPDPERLCTAPARKPEVLMRANRLAEASSRPS